MFSMSLSVALSRPRVALACVLVSTNSFLSTRATAAAAPGRVVFALPSAPLSQPAQLAISQGDLTQWRGPAPAAVVNAANERCLGGGGVDGAIHRAAGPKLKEACRKLPEISADVRCPTGQAVITPAFDLPCEFVIHTVGPNLSKRGADAVGAAKSDKTLLNKAFEASFRVANEQQLSSVAFPAISCGVFAYPLHEAAAVAVDTTVKEHGKVMLVEFVLFGPDTFAAFRDAAEAALGPPLDATTTATKAEK